MKGTTDISEAADRVTQAVKRPNDDKFGHASGRPEYAAAYGYGRRRHQPKHGGIRHGSDASGIFYGFIAAAQQRPNDGAENAPSDRFRSSHCPKKKPTRPESSGE